MEHDNNVSVSGYTRWAPKVHHFDKGGSVTQFTIVIRDPERPYDRGAHVEVKVWDDEQLQAMAQGLAEGSEVHVEGRLRQESWQAKDTGKWNNKVLIAADRITDLRTAETATDSQAA